MEDPRNVPVRKKIPAKDQEFLVNSDFFQATPEEVHDDLIRALKRKSIRAGERFIRQGARGNRFYLIQEGTCVVSVEKDNALHPLSKLKAGDLVGEMAILTGENRNAHVDAETDMVVWGLSSTTFEDICRNHPQLREFLTELVAKRFSRSKFTADRCIGKYVIKDVLGQGGWSIVYKAVHSTLNLPVAVKMLKHDLAMDAYFAEKFQNEAHVIARLNHENIVHVYDIEYLYKTIFIVMEYLEGVSLEYVLENMPRMPFSTVLEILIQVCRGLAYAHDNGIVHQDIKPANIFLQSGNKAKIVDFGLACPTGTEDESDLPGTPHYMAPEQIEGESVDQRTDIYSLGIAAFEMATGRRPFENLPVQEILRSHKEEPIPDPQMYNAHLPVQFSELLVKATQKDPKDRYQNVTEVLEHLMLLSATSGLERTAQPVSARKLMNIFVSFSPEHQLEMNRLVEEFGFELARLGSSIQVHELENE